MVHHSLVAVPAVGCSDSQHKGRCGNVSISACRAGNMVCACISGYGCIYRTYIYMYLETHTYTLYITCLHMFNPTSQVMYAHDRCESTCLFLYIYTYSHKHVHMEFALCNRRKGACHGVCLFLSSLVTVHLLLSVYIHTCIHTYIHTCIYIYIYRYIHTHSCTYICIYLCLWLLSISSSKGYRALSKQI